MHNFWCYSEILNAYFRTDTASLQKTNDQMIRVKFKTLHLVSLRYSATASIIALHYCGFWKH